MDLKSFSVMFFFLIFINCTLSCKKNSSVIISKNEVITSSPNIRLKEKVNFLIIDIDSMRPDRIYKKQNGKYIAPNLAKISKLGAYFSNMFSNGGWTAPALTSLLAGVYPLRSKNKDKQEILPWIVKDSKTLPEIFQQYGYQTAVFWGKTIPFCLPEYSTGFDYVFDADMFDNYFQDAAVTSFLEEKVKEPFFILIHDIDMHTPGPKIPEKYFHPFMPPGFNCEPIPLDFAYRSLIKKIGKTGALEHVIRHYDGALAFYDNIVGDILKKLKSKGLYKKTVIVLISDHAEDLLEHEIIGHGQLFDIILHVPLIIVDPALGYKGVIINNTIQTIDIAPTLLSRAGIPVPGNMIGYSILPLLELEDGKYPEREVISITCPEDISIRTDAFKLIIRGDYPPVIFNNIKVNFEIDSKIFEDLQNDPRQLLIDSINLIPEQTLEHKEAVLFDLKIDPLELHDILNERPDVADALRAKLTEWYNERIRQIKNARQIVLGDRQKEILQKHGYWEKLTPEDKQ